MHALVTRGGWTSGQWVPVPYVDPACAEQLFRYKVIRLLQRAGLLDEDRTRLLLSWPVRRNRGLVLRSFPRPIGEMNMGLTPQKLVMTGLVWGLVEIVIATIAGACVYKEV